MTFVLFIQAGVDTPAGWVHADRVNLDYTEAPARECEHCTQPLNSHTWRVLDDNTTVACSEKPA